MVGPVVKRMAAAGSAARTGIGAPARRIEDERFLIGQGRIVDDMKLPDMVFAYVAPST